MLNLSRLRRHPPQFHRLVGLRIDQFAVLLAAVDVAYGAHEEERLTRRVRQRAVGAGARLARAGGFAYRWNSVCFRRCFSIACISRARC